MATLQAPQKAVMKAATRQHSVQNLRNIETFNLQIFRSQNVETCYNDEAQNNISNSSKISVTRKTRERCGYLDQETLTGVLFRKG
jgi:hypothetical protein